MYSKHKLATFYFEYIIKKRAFKKSVIDYKKI